MVLAALCLLLTFVEGAGRFPLFLFVILLITLGLAALFVRYGEQAGSIAKIALGIGILGGIAGAVSCLMMTAGYLDGRYLTNICMAVMFGGLFVFGLIAHWVKPMARGNWLPALAGFWWVFIVISAYVNPQVTGRGPEVPFWASFSLFALMSLSLAALGYILQSDARQERAIGGSQQGAIK
jgi:hypothetical protein